ncbi:hypothetical protein AVEN_204711-1 [Araneus ventricosus]|uniref:Uncharacterized protein n=1 Tax=Araneus ventricosus TaxID=182803 RepID=A0A4Y2M7T6_ARAVE|nr:hypothetical protein AVEN_204711-1 [Araneus ventricosus]
MKGTRLFSRGNWENITVPRLTPTQGSKSGFRGYFQHVLASFWGNNLGSSIVFSLLSQRGVKRPSGHSNLISNYSEFQLFQFSKPNFIGFPQWRKVFPSRIPKIAEWNNCECPA